MEARPRTLRRLVLLAGLAPASMLLVHYGLFGMPSARRARNEAAAERTLRMLEPLQRSFRSQDLDGDGVLDYADCLTELSLAGLIDAELATKGHAGYRFTLSGSTFDWMGTAAPDSPRVGRHQFVRCSRGCFHRGQAGRPLWFWSHGLVQ